MIKLFGTDGIRGVANIEPMTSETTLKIGQALAYLLSRKGHRPRIIIGKDTRLSGYMLESALASGMCSMGADVILVGPMPTPGIAFLTSSMNADAGVVISASHNPYEDNGFKIFKSSGMKLNNDEEREMEELINSGKLPSLLPPSQNIGKAYRETDALGRYIVFLRHTLPRNISLDNRTIALDCANGSTYKVAPMLLREMRADVQPINIHPNGININENAGSLFPENLAAAVEESRAEIGLAFDGDGDRLIAVDENGNLVTGDQIIAICALHLKSEGKLLNDTVVTTVMSNLGLRECLEKNGIKRVESPVGDRFVLEKMIESGSIFGGEDSGHIIFRNHHTTGDGIITALQLLWVMKSTGKKLSELSKVMKVYPQKLINITVKEKTPIEELPLLQKVIAEVESDLGDKGRVLVRYSGTQRMIRVMVEGPTHDITNDSAEKIAQVAKDLLA